MTRARLKKVLVAVSGTLLGANVLPTAPSGLLTSSTPESGALGVLSDTNVVAGDGHAAGRPEEPLARRSTIAPHRVYNHITSAARTICSQCNLGLPSPENSSQDGTLAKGEVEHINIVAVEECECCSKCMCCPRRSREERGASYGDDEDLDALVDISENDERKIVNADTVPSFDIAITGRLFLKGSESDREDQPSEMTQVETNDSQKTNSITMPNTGTGLEC